MRLVADRTRDRDLLFTRLPHERIIRQRLVADDRSIEEFARVTLAAVVQQDAHLEVFRRDLRHDRMPRRRPVLERRMMLARVTRPADARRQTHRRAQTFVRNVLDVLSPRTMTRFAADAGKNVRRRPVDKSAGLTEADRMTSETVFIRVLPDVLKRLKRRGMQRLEPVVMHARMAVAASRRADEIPRHAGIPRRRRACDRTFLAGQRDRRGQHAQTGNCQGPGPAKCGCELIHR